MKPAVFDYHAPRTVDEALGLLAQYGGDAKPLAGGQSLVPTMNFRLAQPAALIDLNGIDDLFYLHEGEGGLRCGAMTRQRTVEHSSLAQRLSPLLHEAMPHIAHTQIRNPAPSAAASPTPTRPQSCPPWLWRSTRASQCAALQKHVGSTLATSTSGYSRPRCSRRRCWLKWCSPPCRAQRLGVRRSGPPAWQLRTVRRRRRRHIGGTMPR